MAMSSICALLPCALLLRKLDLDGPVQRIQYHYKIWLTNRACGLDLTREVADLGLT